MNSINTPLTVDLVVVRAEFKGSGMTMIDTPLSIKVGGYYHSAAVAGDIYPIEVPIFKRGKNMPNDAEQYVAWHAKLGSFLKGRGHYTLPTRVGWRKPEGGGYILASKVRPDILFARYGMVITPADFSYMMLYREKSGALLARESKVWSVIDHAKVGIVYADKSHGLKMDGPLWLSINSAIVKKWNVEVEKLGTKPAVVGDVIQVSGMHIGTGFSALKGACMIVDDQFIIAHLLKLNLDGAQTFGYETLPISELREMVWATDMSAKRSADVFGDRPDVDPQGFDFTFGVHTWGPDRVTFGGTLGAQMMERLFPNDPAFVSEIGEIAGAKVRAIVEAVIAHKELEDDSLLIEELSSKLDLDSLASSDDSASLVRASQVLAITKQLDIAYGTTQKLQEAVSAAIKVALKFRVPTAQAFRAYAVSEYMYRSFDGAMPLGDDYVALGNAWHELEGDIITDDNGVEYKEVLVKRSPVLSHRALLVMRAVVGHADLKGVVLPMSNQGTNSDYLAARGMACDFDGDMLDVYTVPEMLNSVRPNTQSDWDFIAKYSSVSLKYMLSASWKQAWYSGHMAIVKEYFIDRMKASPLFPSQSDYPYAYFKLIWKWDDFKNKIHKLNPKYAMGFIGTNMLPKDDDLSATDSTLYKAVRCENTGTKVGQADNIVHTLAVSNLPAGVIDLHGVQDIIGSVKHANKGGIAVPSMFVGDDIKYLRCFKKQSPMESWNKKAKCMVRDDYSPRMDQVMNPYWKGMIIGYAGSLNTCDAPHVNNALYVDSFHVTAAGVIVPNKVKIIRKRLDVAMPFFGFFGGGEFLSLFGEKVGAAKMKLVVEPTLFGSALQASREYSIEIAKLLAEKSAIWSDKNGGKRTRSDMVQFRMDEAKAVKNAAVAHAQGRVDHVISWFTRAKENKLNATEAVDLFFRESVSMHVRNQAIYADTYNGRVSLWVTARHTPEMLAAVNAILSLGSVEDFEEMIADLIFVTVHGTGKGSTLLWLVDSEKYLKRLADDSTYIPRRDNVRWANTTEWEDWFKSMVATDLYYSSKEL